MASFKNLSTELAATRKGAARAARILDETLAVITEHGHQDLTLDEIARRIGIAKGNLQYYFPTRGDLLHAAFAEHIDRHKADWLASAQAPVASETERLRRQLLFELQANRNAPFITQETERMALALRDPLMKRLSDDWHHWVTTQYADLIAALHPDLPREVCLHRAIALYSLMVGSYCFTTAESAVPEAQSGLDDTLVDMAIAVATTRG